MGSIIVKARSAPVVTLQRAALGSPIIHKSVAIFSKWALIAIQAMSLDHQ